MKKNIFFCKIFFRKLCWETDKVIKETDKLMKIAVKIAYFEPKNW